MSENPVSKPSRRDLLRPLEMVGGAAIAAIFVGLIVLMVTREWVFAGIALGVVFIIVLVVLAVFTMTIKPDAAETAELDEDGPGPLGH
jgi:hypothetical protein